MWCTPIKIQPVDSRDVQVWCGSISSPNNQAYHHLSTLSLMEKSRISKFKFTEDAQRFALGRFMLRAVISKNINLPPTSVNLALTESGKPWLPSHPKISFNISHSADYVLVTISEGCQIGVDIEQVKPAADLPTLAARYFSNEENLALNNSVSDFSYNFFRCWTRKEAVIKADGRGLQIPLDSFSVDVNETEYPQIVIHDPSFFSSKGQLYDLSLPTTYVGALYVHSTQKKLLTLRFNDSIASDIAG